MDSNGDQQINLVGRIDVDILMGIEREMSQISDWRNGEYGRMTMTVKLELGIREGMESGNGHIGLEVELKIN